MGFVQDVRFGVRVLRKSPAFSVAAVLALGLGVGANTTVFTWLKSVLLEPLPGVEDGDRLVTLSSARGESRGYSTRYREYLYYREHNQVFSGLAAYELSPVNLAREGKPEIALAGLVTADYFTTLGVRPGLGRFFRPDEGQGIGAHPLAVLSYPLWRRLFPGDSRAQGRALRQTVSLDRHPYMVIGVAPAEFMGSYGGIAQDLWVPITQQPQLVAGGDQITTGRYPVQITGRLRPGATLARVQADLDVLSRRQAQADPKLEGWRAVAFPLARSQRGLTSSLLPVVEALMAVVGVVLVIACLNVANLLLARALTRRREITIRLALGAGRARLVRQLLAESLLLAALGGVAGAGIAALAAKTLPLLLPPLGVPLGLNLALDSRVLGFTALIAIVTVFIFGLLPSVQASGVETADALKEDCAATTAGRRHSALRQGLVVVQLGLSLTALIAAGLVGKSLLRTLEQPPGFVPSNLLLTSLDLFMGGYDRDKGRELYGELLDRVRALPGVQSASLTDYAPLGLSGGGNLAPVKVPGHLARPGEDASFVLDAVGPRYLRTLGITLAAGRDFDERDRASDRAVVIVNETFARRFFPAGLAIGRHVEVRGVDREVVGVMRDYKYRSLAEEPSPQLLVPFLQDYRSEMILVVRTAGEPLGMLPTLRRAVAGLDPALPLFQTMSFTQRLAHSLFAQRILSELLAALGLLAAVLAAVGLFGVMSYFVGQRPREIGIRMALGARRGEVLWMVLAQGLRLVAGGTALGLAAAAVAARLLRGLLPGVGSIDPGVFAGVAAGLAAVALLACYLPARRAASMEPFTALRHE